MAEINAKRNVIPPLEKASEKKGSRQVHAPVMKEPWANENETKHATVISYIFRVTGQESHLPDLHPQKNLYVFIQKKCWRSKCLSVKSNCDIVTIYGCDWQ